MFFPLVRGKNPDFSERIESSWTCTHRYYPCAYTAYMYELIRVNSQIKVTGENVPTFAAKFELPSVKQLPEMFKHQNFASKGWEISPCIVLSTNKELGLEVIFPIGMELKSYFPSGLDYID